MISRATSHPVNISTTIRNHQGVDISSSFEVRIYRLSLEDAVSKAHNTKHPPHNTTNDLNSRTERPKTQFAQLVNACPPNETLVSSHCDQEAGGDFAMQKYVYNCQRTETVYDDLTGEATGTRPLFRIRDGHCADDEMCVQIEQPALMAACVKVWLFDDFSIDKNGMVRGMLGGSTFNLENMHLYATVSGDDKTTPLGMSNFEIDGSTSSKTGAEGSAGEVQRFRCRNCVDLNAGAFQADTNALKVQATLASVATTGILWLGLVSG